MQVPGARVVGERVPGQVRLGVAREPLTCPLVERLASGIGLGELAELLAPAGGWRAANRCSVGTPALGSAGERAGEGFRPWGRFG
jgi:hypothetical protein